MHICIYIYYGGNRVELMTRLLRKEEHALSSQQIHDIAHEAAGYSGADVKSLCAEVCSESSRTKKKEGAKKYIRLHPYIHPIHAASFYLQSLQECMYVCGSTFI